MVATGPFEQASMVLSEGKASRGFQDGRAGEENSRMERGSKNVCDKLSANDS